MQTIEWDDFAKIELRAGTILSAEIFKKARTPAYIIHVDFGAEIGTKKTSAQIADIYQVDELVGKQIIGVVNFPVKQIGPMRSEFLLTGLYTDAGVVMAVPERAVKNGAKLG